MSRLRIDKTLIILKENELRQVMYLAKKGDSDAIYAYVRDVIAKRMEEALRKRCG
jgi:hypothetical protein